MSERRVRKINTKIQKNLSLPVSYKQLFAFTYRTNWMLILKTSLMLALFSIPFLVSIVFKGILETNILSVEGVEQSELYSRLMTFRSFYSLVILLCFVIFSIGFAGALNVMKKFLTNEGVLFSRDFFKGIKNNSLSFIGITFFYGLILCLFNFILNIPGLINYYSGLLVVFIILSVILITVYFLTLQINMIYKVSFFKMIKNAFLMFIAKFPYALLMILFSVIPMVVSYMIPVAMVYYISMLLYVSILFGNSALLITIFSLYIFDETVNKKQFPEIYRKGLFTASEIENMDEGFQDDSEIE